MSILKAILASLAMACAGLAACATMSSDNTEVAPAGSVDSAVISGIYADPIQLDRGSYHGEPFVPGGASRPTVALLAEPRALVDIDADGDPEWLVILAESSGGSGTYHYLAVLQQQGSGFHSVSTVLLGDRIQVERVFIEGTTIRVDLLASGKYDPACCPTEPRTYRWHWVENELKPVLRLAGNLVYGHEAREFVTCDGSRYWVTDATGGDLRQTYQANIETPYQPLFAEVLALRLPAPNAGFATPFDEQLRVTNLQRLETEGPGCALDLGGARIRAFGVEPFWHVDVKPDELRFSRLGQVPLTFAISARETAASRQILHGERNGDALTLMLNENRCINPMSGSVFAYTAALRWAGETLSGCALAPLPRRAN